MSQLSIRPLHKEGATDILLDLFFVHGLGGDAIQTWHPKGRPEDLWPRWLAEDHPEMAVWTIGYPAKGTKWAGGGSGMALPDRGKQVLDYLIGLNFGHRPIAFVAHSLGGLLVKQILRASVGLGVSRYRSIGDKTRGVIFLATPHVGSDLSGLAKALALIARPTEEVEDLRAHNPYLIDLADWYRNQAPNLGVTTYAYRENRKVAGKVWVVEPADADPGIAGALCIPQDEDHFTIAKPTDRKHPVYVGVRSTLATLLQLERERNKLTLALDEVEMTVVTQPPVAPSKSGQVAKHDGQLFQDLERSFEFKLPQGKGWSAPQWMTEWDLLARSGVGEDEIERAKNGVGLLPMGKMIGEGTALCLFYGTPIVAKLTDDTTTRATEVILKRLKDLSKTEGEPFGDEEIQRMRHAIVRQNVPVGGFVIQNCFSVHVMRKDLAAQSPVTPNLSNLFMMMSRAMPTPIDNIVANELSILWGSTTTALNVEIAGEVRELTSNTMNSLVEGSDFFYNVSIYYSPQTDNPLLVWSQLQEMAQSFTVLGNE